MSPAPNPLEQNLAALLSRAYAPVVPRPAFRTRLVALLGAGIAHGARPEAVRRTARVWRLAALFFVPLVLWIAARIVDRVVVEPPSGGSGLLAGDESAPDSGASDPSGAAGGAASVERPAPSAEQVASAERTPAATTPALPADGPAAALVPDPAGELVPGRASLAGRVMAPAFGAPAASFEVVLLRQVGLPDVADPERHAFRDAADGLFAIDGLEPGTYTVFVRAAGFATWKAERLELAPGARHEIAVGLDTGAALRGRVLDAASGRPIEGAWVLSEHAAPTQALPLDLAADGGFMGAVQSDHEGRFELPHLAPGTHVLRASAAGHGAAWSEALSIEAGVEPPEVVLELGPEASLFGRVARDDGTLWAGAVVVASLIDYTSARPRMTCQVVLAEADGVFAVGGLPAGTYVVLNPLEAELGRSPRIKSVELAEGARVRVDLPDAGLGKGVAVRVTGRLLDAGGVPLAEVDLTLMPEGERFEFRSVRTGQDGRFELPDVPPGEYVAYVMRKMSHDMTQVGPLSVPAVPELEQELRLESGAIEGRVTGADGAPLGEAVVILERPGSRPGLRFVGKELTRADGRYAFEGLPAGEYTVGAYATSGRHGQELVEGVVLLAGQRRAGVDLALPLGGALTVEVRDASGRPVAGAQVTFTDERGRRIAFDLDERTDEFGKLHVRGMNPGRWTVRAGHEDRAAEGQVDLRPEEQHVLRLRLAPRAEAPTPNGDRR